jgi:hypothetical protein
VVQTFVYMRASGEAETSFVLLSTVGARDNCWLGLEIWSGDIGTVVAKEYVPDGDGRLQVQRANSAPAQK